jgi:hypothetical protein
VVELRKEAKGEGVRRRCTQQRVEALAENTF